MSHARSLPRRGNTAERAAVGSALRPLVLIACFMPRHAQAAQPALACGGPRIEADRELDPRWRGPLQTARERLAQHRDLDHCAVVSLKSSGATLHIELELADGRRATRTLRDSQALTQTLEALLSIPEDQPEAPRNVGVKSAWREPREVPMLMPDTRSVPHITRFEAGVGLMGRLASAPLYGGVGVAAFAELSLDPWLAGVTTRWDGADVLVTDAPPSGFNMQTLALGVIVGNRSEFGVVTLDSLVGPEILAENQEAFGNDTSSEGIGGGVTDFRLDLTFRVATRGTIRWFAQGDVDASPSRLRRRRVLDATLPALPAWSLGLAIGVACGTR